ncbi:hypothetical protein EMCRGX_G024259 [Ephydatia muelleri]
MSEDATLFYGCLRSAITSDTTSELMCCKFNLAGDLIATGNANGAVTVFQPHSSGAVYELRPSSGALRHLPVTGVHFRKVGSPTDAVQNNILLASYSSGHVRHWHITTGQCLSTIKEDRETLAAAYSSDYRSFVTVGSDSKVHLYDESSLKLVSTFERSLSSSTMDGHASRVFAVRYHPSDPTSFLSAGWDDTIQFWDTRQSHSVRRISGPHICGDSLDIDSDTYDILTGSWSYSDTLQVWDFASGKLLSTFQPTPQCKLYAACWLRPGVALAGGTQAHLTVVADTRANKELGGMRDMGHSVYGLDYHQRSNTVAVAAGSKLYSVALSSTLQALLNQEH